MSVDTIDVQIARGHPHPAGERGVERVFSNASTPVSAR
jgi:hypothetical protein